MSASRLRLKIESDEDRSASQQVSRINIGDIPMLSTTIKVAESARDLGVILDAELTMSAHVTALCRSGCFQLRQLRPFTQSLTRPTEAAKTLVQAFISCHLDYCNSLLHGVTDNVMRRVQSLQNAAARLITGVRRRDHITPVLCQLHWLPVRRRVEFKLACLGRLYLYLADNIHLVSEGNRRSLRSSSDNMFAVPRTHNSFGDRSFGAVGPRIWNSLPRGLRTLDISYKHFKALLKTYMFRQGHSAL